MFCDAEAVKRMSNKRSAKNDSYDFGAAGMVSRQKLLICRRFGFVTINRYTFGMSKYTSRDGINIDLIYIFTRHFDT